jgi:hypothetical protein
MRKECAVTGSFFAQRFFYGTCLTTIVLVFIVGVLSLVAFLARSSAEFLGTLASP